MARRKVIVKESASENIAAIAAFIVSKGMISTAIKFVDEVHDFIYRLGDDKRSYPICQDPKRKLERYKCVNYKKKFTIVLIESDVEIIICDFISSQLIYW